MRCGSVTTASLAVVFCTLSTVWANAQPTPTDTAIENLCKSGDLYGALSDFQAISDDARALHSASALQLILNANADDAVALHKLGKAADFTAIPPLAKMHLDGKDCAGLGDLFYVTAVIIKELVDTNKALPNLIRAMKTLITLTSDSGLPHAAENAMKLALTLEPEDASLHFRAAVMTPGVYESLEHINVTLSLLTERIDQISDPIASYALKGLDEFTMSPTFYFVYQGHNDRDLLQKLQHAYIQAHPKLGEIAITANVARQAYLYQHERHPASAVDATTTPTAVTQPPSAFPRKLRVGFVSSHFRRHSICKLFCGVMTHLNPDLYEVYAFSSLQQNREDAVTQSLRESHVHYVPIGMTFIQNRNEVTDRAIDILVYLDVGMDPSTSAWAAARLAPIQMVIWGHPSTTGYTSIDYYLTSEKFHRHTYTRHHSERTPGPAVSLDSTLVEGASTSSARGQESPYAYSYFAEQLVQFDTLGFFFARPVLDADLSAVLKALSTAAPAEFAEHASQATREYLPHILRPRDYYQALARALKKGKTAASKQLKELVIAKLQRNASIALCPQHMPKFHPDFDVVMTTILLQSPNSLIVLVDNRQKLQWRRTLVGRWRAALTHALQVGGQEGAAAEDQVEGMLSRIVWVSSLTPQEYLTLLAIGDVMLDPFPFGGGVTTLESIAVCTPVITLPSGQSVPQLGAGMLYHMHLADAVQKYLVVATAAQYLQNTLAMLQDAERGSDRTGRSGVSLVDARREVCAKAHVLYNNDDTMQDWNTFLSQAV